MSEKHDAPASPSRRAFLKGLGTTAVSSTLATATAGARQLADELALVNQEQIYGPGPVALTFNVNGKPVTVDVPPSTTLLEALRDHLPYTGTKEVCDRASCGACTVLLDGKPVNACMKLAIEAQAQPILTVEGLAQGGELSALQQAFIEEDGLMCGYCTSGFLMSLTALLNEHPKPTEATVRKACAGNLCRCGTYPRIFRSALRAAGVPVESQTEVISWSHGHKLA